jgi:1,4-alpha-glucan branching enzyme
MAQEEGRIGTYREFTECILPRIVRSGYNVLQLMGIQEHPYYASFGYHVSSFFAASSRFGTPEELKELIDAAHGARLFVIMDLIHSHAVGNDVEGLSRFDGTPICISTPAAAAFMRPGDRGASTTAKRGFAVSAVELPLLAFRIPFDGFASTALPPCFTATTAGQNLYVLDDYFNPNVDETRWFTWRSPTRHSNVRPRAVTLAEDVSGMPALALPAGRAASA